jgi:hypothetical protein
MSACMIARANVVKVISADKLRMMGEIGKLGRHKRKQQVAEGENLTPVS